MLASVGWYGFYTQYFYSADSSFVPVIYDRMRRYLHDVWQLDRSGLVIERHGEWSWGDWGENVDIGVLTNCWYYLALKAEKAFAVQLNRQEDVDDITATMNTLEKVFNLKFWTGSAYRAPGYRGKTDDRAQAMAILSGLAPKKRYRALANIMRKEAHASPYMEKYVLEALFDIDYPTYALERMKKRYTKMMNYGDYTTLFEGWGIGAEGFGGGTINHAWSGGPLTLLSQKVCGVTPTSPGFRTFLVKPQMGGLTEASATVPTHFGDIKVNLRKKDRKLILNLVVPEGTKAEVQLSPKRSIQLAPGSHEVSQTF